MAESSCPQIQLDPDLAPSTNPIITGKRGAAEVVVAVGNKKHKQIHSSSHQQREELSANTEDLKKASVCNDSRQEDEDTDTFKENAKLLETPKKNVEVTPAIKASVTTHDDAERVCISNEYKEEDKDDCSKEDHQHLLTKNRSERLNLATERTERHSTHDMGSKTLYLGNLSFLIEEDDVRDFFKNVGEIADIRFAIKDDRFLGYGHIEFTTAEAAQEALKLNSEVLLDRQVTLDIPRRERGAYSPGNSIHKSNQRGGHAQVKTVYVRGFESSEDFDNIKSALEKHFEKCGEISRLCIPKDHFSGAPRGVAFIEFADSNGFHEALGLHGTEIGGNKLIVEEAKKQRGEGREGSGYGGGGGGWSGSGGRESGSGGGWSGSAGSHVRESGFGVGRSGSRGSWSDSAGSYVRESGRSGYGGGWSGYGGSYVRESGYGSGWSGPGGSYAKSGSTGSRLRVESGYGSFSHTASGSGSVWRRESGYNRGGGSGWGYERGSGYGGWGRGSGSNDRGFNSGGRGSNHRAGILFSGSRRGGRT